MMLPEMLLSSSPAHGTPRTPPQEITDLVVEHQAITTASLNAYATEFIPTQSMSCPLVGICEVIVEGDESQDQPSTELRFTSTHSLMPIQQENLPLLQNTSKAGGKQFWRKPKPSPLVVQPRVPQVTAAEVLSEEQIQRRVRSIEVCKTSKEYSSFVEEAKLLGSDAEPLTPDPRDSRISKRRWLRAVQDWRDELARRYNLELERSEGGSRPEAASVASTEAEEAQSSEAGDSTTDDSSSAHWSSR